MVEAERVPGPELSRLQLVLGPARSGKSRWAEHLAAISGQPVVVVATGPSRPADQAWQQRLERHRQRRPAHWTTLETPEAEHLVPALQGLASDQLALVDSVGTWVASALDLEEPAWQELCHTLLGALVSLRCGLILVSEQTGWGVVPPTAIGGLFRDRLGMIERQLVERASSSWLVVAGRAISLSAISHAIPAD